MDRIQTSTKAVDKFGPGKHGFTAGNPATGTPATQLSEIFFDSVQEEICAIIEAAGIALDPNNRAQLLAALRAAGVFQTPAQFDNSTKAATTAFVKTAQGNLSGFNAYNASANIPLADIGKLVAYYGVTAGQTLTLPAVATVPVGYGYTLVNQSSKDVTIKGNGAENINYNIAQTGQGIANTIVLSPGDSIEISSNGVDKWNVVGFTSTQQFPSSKSPFTIGAAGAARGSIGSSGYHKYPNGVIEQWATIQLADSVATTWTFPVAFPNACMGINLQNLAIAAGQSGNTIIALPQVDGITASTATIETRNTHTAGTLTWFFVRVIGY